jgi:hypothetical protein
MSPPADNIHSFSFFITKEEKEPVHFCIIIIYLYLYRNTRGQYLFIEEKAQLTIFFFFSLLLLVDNDYSLGSIIYTFILP